MGGDQMINLKGMDGVLKVRVSGHRVSIPLGEFLMVKFNHLSKSYAIVGKVCSSGDDTLSFDVCGAQSSSDMLKFNISVPVCDITSLRVMSVRDVPLMINWSWIGLDIRRKYFGGVI
jgi:hypothetical protein